MRFFFSPALARALWVFALCRRRRRAASIMKIIIAAIVARQQPVIRTGFM
jgi:hypothetical protein